MADLERISQALEEGGIAVKSASLDEQGRGGLVRLGVRMISCRPKISFGARWVMPMSFQSCSDHAGVAAQPWREPDEAWFGPLRRRFLLEVDMEKAIETRLNVSEGEVKSLLRKERVRYRSLPNLKDAVQLGFADQETLSAAQSLIRKNFTDFELTTSERNGQFVLRLTLTEAKLAEIREYSIKQNLTTVRNRVNELGVAEPLVQRQGPTASWSNCRAYRTLPKPSAFSARRPI